MAKSGRTFSAAAVLAAARAGTLTGAALRRTIKTAEDFGLAEVVRELKFCTVNPASFARDAAPDEVRDRVARGISALTAMGHSLSRTKQMLKNNGVVATLERFAQQTDSVRNCERLRDAGLEDLTAEAIILDYPDLFSEQAKDRARERLGR
jgi:hypothetical protein